MGRTIDMVVGDKAIKVKMYTGGDDPDLPDHVKKLPTLARSRWVNTYTYALTDYKDGKRALEEADNYTTLSVNEVIGMGKSKELPTSDHEGQEAGRTPVQPPARDWLTKLKSMFSVYVDSLDGSVEPPVQVPGPENIKAAVTVYKGTDDRMRVLTVYSNNFKDREKQIITEAAHKEYVQAAEEGRASYPDLHLWHGGPSTKWGTVETVSYVDGFAIAGGVVDPGKEHIALKVKELADKGEVAVSFGYLGLLGPDHAWHMYRPFEISPLPVSSEANPVTNIDLIASVKENNLPFSDSKKKWFKDHFGMTDVAIADAEKAFGAMAESMKNAGIDYKSADDAPPPTPPDPAPVPPPPPTPPPPPPRPFVESNPELASQQGNPFTDLATAVKALTEKMTSMETAFAAYKEQDGRTVEQRAQDQVIARIAGAGAGHRPTQSNGNILALKEQDGGSGDDWLDAALGHSLGGPLVPAGAGAGIAHAPNNGEVK